MYSASQPITRCSKNRARDAHIAKSVRTSVLNGSVAIWLEDSFASGPHRSCIRGSYTYPGPSLQSIGAYIRIGIAHLFVAITGRSLGGCLVLTERTSHVECFSASMPKLNLASGWWTSHNRSCSHGKGKALQPDERGVSCMIPPRTGKYDALPRDAMQEKGGRRSSRMTSVLLKFTA
jgi:hypothetical protein